MAPSKILVVGAIQGQLKKAFEKISKLHAKQNLNTVLITGDLFGHEEDDNELEALLNGSLTIPLPTYFMLGDSALPQKVRDKLEVGDEVCPNLVCLGRKRTFTTSEGVRVVSLGGRQVQNVQSVTEGLNDYDPLFSESEARALNGAKSAHMLLTNQWPAQITRRSKIPVPEGAPVEDGVQSIANLCITLKPWYHFSSSPAFVYEREPFKHAVEYDSLEPPPTTRFKSLASIQATTKEWMTAFVLDPTQASVPEQSTPMPFLNSTGSDQSRKRPAPTEYSRYAGDSHNGYSGRSHKRSRVARDPNDCFMCLNKTGFKTHMVVSIGDESMLTVLRGPLPLPSTFPQLSSSGHVMIIPHYHAADEQSQGRRPEKEVTAEFAEMTKYRKALSNMIGSKSHGELGTVCWEVNRTGIRHLHWQLMACKAEQIRKGLVEAAFKVLREQRGHAAFQPCDPDQELPQRSDYFRVWMWSPTTDPVQLADHLGGDGEPDTGNTKAMYFPLSTTEENFNIWFGREVMAGILQLENRINWKTAMRAEDAELAAEEEDATGLKQDFEEFDFAMQ